MVGLLFGIYMAVTAQMPDTVKEYAHMVPKMPETVQEYMDRGREWAEHLDWLNQKKVNCEVNNLVNNLANYETSYETAPAAPEGMTYYSNMELTAYVWTGNPCADGVYPAEGYTAACNDPNLWHKWVYIDGVGLRYIHDTGGMSSNVIDIYMGTYDACVSFGRQTANVYILED